MQGKNNSVHGRGSPRALRIHLAALSHAGTVVMHDGKSLVRGIVKDISETGLFVETEDQEFELGQTIHVTVRLPDVMRSFSQSCVVKRCNKDARFPPGIGLQYTSTPKEIRNFFSTKKHNSWGEYFLLSKEQRTQKILLVDQDDSFSEPLLNYSRGIGVHMDLVNHLGNFSDLMAIGAYDKLLVAYDLEPHSGLQIAEVLNKYLPDLPLVMLAKTGQPWQSTLETTPNITAVANKWDGAREILTTLLRR